MIVAAEGKVSRCLVALQGETSLPLDSMFPPSDFRRTGEGNGNEEKEGGEGEEEGISNGELLVENAYRPPI